MEGLWLCLGLLLVLSSNSNGRSLVPSSRYRSRHLHSEKEGHGHWLSAAAANLTQFKLDLFKHTEEALQRNSQNDPPGHRRFDIYNPFVSCPPGTSLQHVGIGNNVMNGIVDGSKLLCVPLQAEPGCVVFSLGGNNQYEFEEAILRDTPCIVHTFDCTVNGRSLNPQRHFFHKMCAGTPRESELYSNVVSLQSLFHNLTSGSHVYLLKVDVEGFELGMMAELNELSHMLPMFIAVEIHHTRIINGVGHFQIRPGMEADAQKHDFMWGRQALGQAELSLYFLHMANLGYAIISREDNPQGTHCCSEYTFIRVPGMNHHNHRPIPRNLRGSMA